MPLDVAHNFSAFNRDLLSQKLSFSPSPAYVVWIFDKEVWIFVSKINFELLRRISIENFHNSMNLSKIENSHIISQKKKKIEEENSIFPSFLDDSVCYFLTSK